MKFKSALLLSAIIASGSLPQAHALQAKKAPVITFTKDDIAIRVKYNDNQWPQLGAPDFTVASVQVTVTASAPNGQVYGTFSQGFTGPGGRLPICGTEVAKTSSLCFWQVNAERGANGLLWGTLALPSLANAPAGAVITVMVQANAVPGTGLKKPGTENALTPGLVLQTAPTQLLP
jgi:hypothetical protein